MHKHFTNPTDQRSGPNCGVTAVAIASGVSFSRAWNVFKTMGVSYYQKRNWKGGTYTHHQANALDKLGIEHKEVAFNRCNLRTLVNTLESGKLYMVTTGRHVQMVMDGHVIDQRGAKHIEEFWGKKKFVEKILEIKTPFKHAIERDQVIEAQKTNVATIPTQSHDTLFPSLFRDSKRDTAHSSAQQLTLF